MKLRELKEKVAHKVHHETDLPDVAREDDNAFLHMSSKETGAADTAYQRETKGGTRSVY
jgi:hypothetical protein